MAITQAVEMGVFSHRIFVSEKTRKFVAEWFDFYNIPYDFDGADRFMLEDADLEDARIILEELGIDYDVIM